MAYSYDTYTASGSNDTFNVPCPYLSKSHVHVYLDGVETSAFTWPTTATVKLDAVPAAGVQVKVQRITPFSTALVDFVNGTIADADDLDTAVLQAVYMTQENADNGNLAADIYDQFDDRYLGSKSSNPTTDNDGAALLEGALYWNSVSKELRVYNGTAWQAAVPLTVPLPVSAGGTGATTAPAALQALLDGLASESAPTINDFLFLGDLSAGTVDKITTSDFLKVMYGVGNLSLAGIDPVNDTVNIYDASAGAMKKAPPNELPTILRSMLRGAAVITGGFAAATYTNGGAAQTILNAQSVGTLSVGDLVIMVFTLETIMSGTGLQTINVSMTNCDVYGGQDVSYNLTGTTAARPLVVFGKCTASGASTVSATVSGASGAAGDSLASPFLILPVKFSQ